MNERREESGLRVNSEKENRDMYVSYKERKKERKNR